MDRSINNPNLVTKMDIVRALAKKSRLTQTVARETLNNVLEIIESHLKKGKRVQIINFGSFYVKERPARTAINPKTRKTIQVPEKKVIKFTPGKALTQSVNKK